MVCDIGGVRWDIRWDCLRLPICRWVGRVAVDIVRCDDAFCGGIGASGGCVLEYAEILSDIGE